jgi:hypothetical protein
MTKILFLHNYLINHIIKTIRFIKEIMYKDVRQYNLFVMGLVER